MKEQTKIFLFYLLVILLSCILAIALHDPNSDFNDRDNWELIF